MIADMLSCDNVYNVEPSKTPGVSSLLLFHFADKIWADTNEITSIFDVRALPIILNHLRRRYGRRRTQCAAGTTDKPFDAHLAKKITAQEGFVLAGVLYCELLQGQTTGRWQAPAIPTFGYKNHVSTDRSHGLIRKCLVTDAAARDGAKCTSS